MLHTAPFPGEEFLSIVRFRDKLLHFQGIGHYHAVKSKVFPEHFCDKPRRQGGRIISLRHAICHQDFVINQRKCGCGGHHHFRAVVHSHTKRKQPGFFQLFPRQLDGSRIIAPVPDAWEMLVSCNHAAFTDPVHKRHPQFRRLIRVVGKDAGTHAHICQVRNDIHAGSQVYIDTQRRQFFSKHPPCGQGALRSLISGRADGHTACSPCPHGQTGDRSALLVRRHQIRDCFRCARVPALRVIRLQIADKTYRLRGVCNVGAKQNDSAVLMSAQRLRKGRERGKFLYAFSFTSPGTNRWHDHLRNSLFKRHSLRKTDGIFFPERREVRCGNHFLSGGLREGRFLCVYLREGRFLCGRLRKNRFGCRTLSRSEQDRERNQKKQHHGFLQV